MIGWIAWAVLVLAALAAFYFLIGYPLVLAFLTKRRAPAIQKDLRHTPTVSVVMAVFNGDQFLTRKLNSLLQLDYPPDRFDILVVSDGSTDRTAEITRSFAADPRVRLLELPRGGKAAALTAALNEVRGEILFLTDVRQILDPMALRHLAANFADPQLGAVTGELAYFEDPGDKEAQTLDVYWRYELWVRRRHSEIDSIFNTTGAIYAVRRSLVSPLPADTLTDDAIIPLRVFFAGYRVIFDPEAVAWDWKAANPAEFKRKVRTLAGLWQVHRRMPQLFSSSNRMRAHFLPHKFGRLALPWCILAVYAATPLLPEAAVRNTLLVNEGLLLLIAAVGPNVPKWFPLRRVFTAARTFVSMNVAAFLATFVFFRSAQTFWVAPTTQLQQPSKQA
jgi:cellulose synthase/poly-beta-1,6-N-acetylglucosamine synthase-like glycosyltransferase